MQIIDVRISVAKGKVRALHASEVVGVTRHCFTFVFVF